jgi:hypothetical protein
MTKTNVTAWHREMRGKVVEAGIVLDEHTDAVLGLVAGEVEQLRSDLELRNQTALDRKEIIRKLEAALSEATTSPV